MNQVQTVPPSNEMARRIAEFDWTSTSIGPVDQWPQSLKSITRFLLQSPIPIVLLWGEDGVMIYNDAYSEFAAGRHPRLLGSKVLEGWPEVADFNANVMRVGLSGGTLSYKDQELVLHRNGRPEKVALDLNYSPVFGDDDRPAGVVAIVTETTLQVRTAERLRFMDALAGAIAPLSEASEVLAVTTRMVGEHLGVSICAYADMDADEDGFTIRGDWTAPGSASIVGHYQLADFGKLAVKNLGAGEPLIVNDTGLELEPDEAATFENIGIRATICMPLVKEGRLTALMAIHDRNPREWTPDELIIIREVTERVWAHVERAGVAADLRASEEKFRTLARAIPNHIWTAQPDGMLDWFNDLVYQYSGAAEGELDGHRWADIVHPDDLAEATARWTEALNSGRTYETEFRLRRHDGEWRWHLARAVPVTNDAGAIVRWIGTNTEVHERVETADKLAHLNATLEAQVSQRTAELMSAEAALRQSQKMEAVGQLTGGLAHDFNNLLTAIIGGLDMIALRMTQGREKDVTRYLVAAQAASKRAAALTHRLLAFSRRQTLDPRPTAVKRLVAGMEDLIRRTVGPSVEVGVEAHVDLWPILVDPNQLENALLNLVINARDAMPHGGQLTISIANRSLEGAAGAGAEIEPGDYVALSVSDTGTGMSPEIMARAFDPFFTTKPLGAGTGLGLSMIYGFARQSGGEVRIKSQMPGGTRVTIYLPRFHGELTDAAQDTETVPQPPLSAARLGETVLIVDDEAGVRMLVSDIVRELGFEPVTASTAAEGLDIIRSDARIDLLISDVGLPGGMDGREMVEVARAVRPDLKVLFITGFAEQAVIGAEQRDAGMSVMTKPFQMDALGGRIRELLQR